MDVKPVRSREDYEAALARIDMLIDALPGSKEEDELEVLGILVADYEDKHEEIGMPSVSEAIRYEMDRLGLKQKDLVPLIGSPPKVSEILSGKRAPSLRMIRCLHEHPGIPAEVLLQEGEPAQKPVSRREA